MRAEGDGLAAVQARAAELVALIDAAPDEQTARPLADELEAIFDALVEVCVLPPLSS